MTTKRGRQYWVHRSPGYAPRNRLAEAEARQRADDVSVSTIVESVRPGKSVGREVANHVLAVYASSLVDLDGVKIYRSAAVRYGTPNPQVAASPNSIEGLLADVNGTTDKALDPGQARTELHIVKNSLAVGQLIAANWFTLNAVLHDQPSDYYDGGYAMLGEQTATVEPGDQELPIVGADKVPQYTAAIGSIEAADRLEAEEIRKIAASSALELAVVLNKLTIIEPPAYS